jgi:hypothetical protein
MRVLCEPGGTRQPPHAASAEPLDHPGLQAGLVRWASRITQPGKSPVALEEDGNERFAYLRQLVDMPVSVDMAGCAAQPAFEGVELAAHLVAQRQSVELPAERARDEPAERAARRPQRKLSQVQVQAQVDCARIDLAQARRAPPPGRPPYKAADRAGATSERKFDGGGIDAVVQAEIINAQAEGSWFHRGLRGT